ncbi:unnamed protein product [Urochloa decumbens]|uniref:PDZ domain-containing protein n=1 Tax=Urochloa decumbens TaxID=240449 RepID=A0ABC9EU39_9POAL
MRLERIENKRLRDEKVLREAEERVERVLKNKAIFDAKSEAWKEQQRKERLAKQESGIYDIDKGDSELFTYWLPYESDDEFGTEFELKHMSWSVEKFTLDLAQCTVGLESFIGDKTLFSCSGTIVEFAEGTGYIVTSASLIRCPDKDEIVGEPKINVWLPNGHTLEGSVLNVDLYYNFCLIKVPCDFNLPSRSFSTDIGFFNFYENRARDVVAIGRMCEPWTFKVASGKLIPKRSRFDCDELLVSSCKISKRGVGGPLMGLDGNMIGMNFYDKKETPFLPSCIVLKCLQHFRSFGKVVRPLHGLRVKTLYEAELSVLEEKMQHGLSEMSGVIVEKLEESFAELSEIKVGDIITHLDGRPFSNAAELGGMLLDTCGKLMQDRQKLNLSDDCNQTSPVMSLKFHVRTCRGQKSKFTTETININKFSPSRLDRWPLPRPIIVRQYAHGKVVDVRRYITASDV